MKKIFVGNLDFGATEESLHSLFAPHGTVERVNLVTDRETGRSRGFASSRSVFFPPWSAADFRQLFGMNFRSKKVNQDLFEVYADVSLCFDVV
jgi:hypothetical protein